MSEHADERYDVYDERYPHAVKEHTCSACKEDIKPGHRYVRVGCVYDGEARTIKRCMRCQLIHLHLRTLGDPGDMLWPDERLNCGEEYKQHWGVEPPPEIAALAFASQDEVQRTWTTFKAAHT